MFDPLRKDPRFQKRVAFPATKWASTAGCGGQGKNAGLIRIKLSEKALRFTLKHRSP
jgi:hypothetical protein